MLSVDFLSQSNRFFIEEIEKHLNYYVKGATGEMGKAIRRQSIYSLSVCDRILVQPSEIMLMVVFQRTIAGFVLSEMRNLTLSHLKFTKAFLKN